MDRTRRALLRDGLAAMALAALPGCASSRRAPAAPAARLTWRNWAGDYPCRPVARLAPVDEDGVRAILRDGRGPVRPVGAGHSFSAIVPTEGTLISLDRMQGVLSVDAATRTAEVHAGTRLHALGAALFERDQMLQVQPDIDDQALAGALATSTHGTGPRFGSMSSYVEGLTLVTPSGDVVSCDAERDRDVFQSARCAVGALGVLTRVRLANTRPERLEERTTVTATDVALGDLERLRDAHQHMEIRVLPRSGVTRGVTTAPTPSDAIALEEDPTSVEQLRAAWAAVGGRADVYGQVVLEALGGLGASAVRRGPGHLVRAHARLSRFREMEYTVPAERGPECVREILDAIEAADLPFVYPIEVRYVKADDVWLSMFEGRDGCTISIHQYADEDEGPPFERIEPILRRYEGRPHWGKRHTLTAPELRALYPRWDDFQAVRARLDPEGRMLNPWLRRTLVDAADA